MRARSWPLPAAVLCFVGAAAAWQSEPSLEQQLVRIQQQIQSGDLRAARAGLDQAVAGAPADPRAWNLLGVVNARENDFAAAEMDFRRAIQVAPRFTGAYLNLGRLYQEHPQQAHALENALSTYQKLLAWDPSHLEANYQAAALLNRAGSYAASLQHLARIPREARLRAPALALRCANQFALGQTPSALDAGKQLLNAPDLSEADVLPILPGLLEHGAGDLALRLLERIAAQPDCSPQTLFKLAELQESRGRYPEARATLEHTLAGSQPSAVLLSQLARLAYRAGDLEGALGYLAHARDLEPANAAIRFFFGMVCVELKLPPEAKTSLSEAVRLDPQNPYYHYALGAILVNERNAEGAVPHFQKFCAARPNDARGRFALGVAYFDAYQPEAARREFLAIVQRPETGLGARLFLGRLAIREDKLDEALDHLQKAIQANPSAPDAYAESGLVHLRRNEYALAGKDLAQAVRITPNHYLANQRLLMLYRRTKDPRAGEQAARVEKLQKTAEDRERLLLRSLEIRPYSP